MSIGREPGYGGAESWSGGVIELAAALWLMDHAEVFLKALQQSSQRRREQDADQVGMAQRPDCGLQENLASGSGKAFTRPASTRPLGPAETAEGIYRAFLEEIPVPQSQKLRLAADLLARMGNALSGATTTLWRQPFAAVVKDAASTAPVIDSYEGPLLSWIAEIEMQAVEIPFSERNASLRKAVLQKGESVPSDLTLNNWAYFLLLAGRSQAATPLATWAVEISRCPRNLDTLGLALSAECDWGRAHECLSEALKLLPPGEEEWAQVTYHQLCVVLQMNDISQAMSLLTAMCDAAPNGFWTRKAMRLRDCIELRVRPQSERETASDRGWEYDIALSFAGEDRKYAEELAERLCRAGVRVFYDEYQKAELWGKNLYDYLLEIYSKKALYCVLLLSKNYHKKRWTNLERQAAQARALMTEGDYILPIMLEAVEIPGFLSTTCHLDWEREGVDGITACVLRKLGR